MNKLLKLEDELQKHINNTRDEYGISIYMDADCLVYTKNLCKRQFATREKLLRAWAQATRASVAQEVSYVNLKLGWNSFHIIEAHECIRKVLREHADE